MISPLVILFVGPVVFNLVVVIAVWMYYTNRRTDSQRETGDGKIYRCENCNLVYVERRLYPVLECPRCRHSNAAVRR